MRYPEFIYDVPKNKHKEQIRERLEYLLNKYSTVEWRRRNPDYYVNTPEFIEYRQLLKELWA